MQENSWYGNRLASCKAACEALTVKNLRSATTEQLDGIKNKARVYIEAGHVISKNERTEKAAEGFRSGDLEAFGALMNVEGVIQGVE